MEKKILAIKDSESAYDTVIFQEQVIKVKRRLSVEDVVGLVEAYVSEYFANAEAKSQVIFAEYALRAKLIDIATDTEVVKESLPTIFSTNIFEDVVLKILNYSFVLDVIQKTIKKNEVGNSFEKKLSDLADMAIEAAGKLSESGFDKSMLEEMQKMIQDVSKLNLNTEPVKREQKTRKENGTKNVQQ